MSERHRKIRVHNSTDLLINLPQEIGTTVNQNMSGLGAAASYQICVGLLPRKLGSDRWETRRIVGAGGVFSSGLSGVDINLVPFSILITSTS